MPNFIKNILKYLVFLIKYKKSININSLINLPISYIYNKKIKIGKNVNIWIWNYFTWNIEIWDNSYINSSNTKLNWWEKNKIIIWKYCSISWNVSIISKNEHNYNLISTSPFIDNTDIWKDTIIWNDVWIWANSIILPWINIWNWAIIWAWSVVTKNIDDYAIVWGNPAKIIKYRFNKEKIEKLKKLNRWDWNIEKIKKYPI